MSSATSVPQLRVHVSLGPRSYQVAVASSSAGALGEFFRVALDGTWAGRPCRAALIVTDQNVGTLPFADRCRTELETVGIAAQTAVVPPGEATKSLETASLLLDRLIEMRADRHTAILALGGGVIGDLAGFVAATYARGVPLLMVPTTLLAQVDSSVGGKVGVNHPRAKNIIGAFHQPAAVWIDVSTLATLPDRELRCGLAEVVKYGVILDSEFFGELEADARALLDRRAESLLRVVSHSCALKADVVTRDEREETGLRAVLNFGHTVAHALESVAGYGGDFQHGEAVAAGMVAECRIAERIGWIGPEIGDRLATLLKALGLPTSFPGLDPGRLMDAMTRDKKNRQGTIRFVLPRTLGKVELTDAPPPDDVHAVIRALSA